MGAFWLPLSSPITALVSAATGKDPLHFISLADLGIIGWVRITDCCAHMDRRPPLVFRCGP
ncbi:protein of unknown function [Methylocaldum szegediense]|uniref:Uncharacterized protein n=1 Tax=Methylocaldum szegediense TaxID=73780 RepID=A0ABM9HZU3_9GAMM|nr:protein of unknown function [Methylocaldum szegediense]